jgi:cytoskeleton protein RodZ
MSEDQEKTDIERAPAEPAGPRGGERLADARRALQISALEVAKELHLDEPKVRALERNEFDVLGAAVFAKGHLRKYAQLVGVDPDDVFADYYQLTRSESMPPVVVGRSRMRREVSPGPWIAAIIVILVAAISYWWFAIESGTAIVPETSPEEAMPVEQSEILAEPREQTAELTTAQADEEMAADDIQSEPVASRPLPEPVVELADGEIRLSLSFSGDCWTEVGDATGRRLFFELGRSGRTVELTGRAPLAVLLGNSENVDVRVNGNEYPVSPSTAGSRTARLTILNQ